MREPPQEIDMILEMIKDDQAMVAQILFVKHQCLHLAGVHIG